jgi:hypothetical protein
LVPNFNLDELAFGRQIWELAVSSCREILFLGAVKTADDELKTVHRVAALRACAQDRRLHVETRLEFGRSWHKAISSIWKPGDLIVCCPDHEIRTNLFRHVSLGSLLAEDLNLPVYILPDHYGRAAFSGKRTDVGAEKAARVL